MLWKNVMFVALFSVLRVSVTLFFYMHKYVLFVFFIIFFKIFFSESLINKFITLGGGGGGGKGKLVCCFIGRIKSGKAFTVYDAPMMRWRNDDNERTLPGYVTLRFVHRDNAHYIKRTKFEKKLGTRWAEK